MIFSKLKPFCEPFPLKLCATNSHVGLTIEKCYRCRQEVLTSRLEEGRCSRLWICRQRDPLGTQSTGGRWLHICWWVLKNIYWYLRYGTLYFVAAKSNKWQNCDHFNIAILVSM